MKVLTLYSGMGGACLGYEAAGMMHVAGVDIDKAAYIARNAQGHPTRQGDLLAYDWSGTVRPDMVHASPPCPSFSKAGRGTVSQQRRALNVRTKGGAEHINNTVRLLGQIRPTWAVIENVCELRRWSGYAGLLDQLGVLFPEVCPVVLDAQNFGVPQTRRRLFIVCGPRAGTALGLLNKWHKPAPQPLGMALGYTLEEWVARSPGRKVYSYEEAGHQFDPGWLDCPAPTVTCQEVKGTRACTKTNYRFNGGPDRASDAAFLALGIRRVTWWEAGVLQGFSTLQLNRLANTQGITDADRYRLIGNAVCPPVAQAIGQAILAVA